MNYILKFYATLSLLFCATLLSAQGFHSSTTKVEYENQSSVLNVTSRFLTNDLEKVIGEKTSNKSNFESKLKSYISNRIVLSVNNAPLKISYYGFQTNDKMTRIYLKAENVSKIESISLKMSMLTDVYADQQNMISFDVNGTRKSMTTHKGSDTATVKF